MSLPSLIEAQNDINQTNYDLVWLDKARVALEGVVKSSAVEDKAYYRRVLFQVKSDIESGQKLCDRIKGLIETGAIK